MDRHGLRKKNGQVVHQVVKQFVDDVAIGLQSIPYNSLVLIIKQWVADYANKMSECSCPTASPASPASSDTVTMAHNDDSNVQNLLGGCDHDSPHLVMEKYQPSALFLESSACSSINDRFSIDSLQTAHVTRSNIMDPCQDALVDTAWNSKLMVLDGKWVAVPMISQLCDLGRCFDTNVSRGPINTHEPVSWEREWHSCGAIGTIKRGEGPGTAEN